MKHSELYAYMTSLTALSQKLVEGHGEFDPVERDWGMPNDDSVATRLWGILNSAESKIGDLLDEVSLKERADFSR